MPGLSAKPKPASISALSSAGGTPVTVKPTPVEAKASAASRRHIVEGLLPRGRDMRDHDCSRECQICGENKLRRLFSRTCGLRLLAGFGASPSAASTARR